MKIKKTEFKGVFKLENKGKKTLLTKNITPNKKYFDEKLIRYENEEYRIFDYRRSKLAAAVIKKIKPMNLNKNNVILYLGASHGYTVSFISDIVGLNGIIFAIEFAPRVMRDLMFLCKQRKNIAPILADANKPQDYENRMCMVDFIFQDIAQKNQAEIFLKNTELFLKDKGLAMIAVKSRSIDITKKPKEIYELVRKKLEQKMDIIDFKTLDPFEKDHCVFLCRRK